MSDVFKVDSRPDGGQFADGDEAALTWDIVRRASAHRAPAVLDLSDCVHLRPYSVACLCGLAELARLRGSPMRTIPPRNRRCADHLARMGMASFLEADWPETETRDTNIHIQRVSWPPGNEGERVVDVLAPRSSLPPRVFPSMVERLDEIILNALTHAESPIECIVAGQAFPAAGYVEFAVLDLGRTIRGHLTSNRLLQKSVGGATVGLYCAKM